MADHALLIYWHRAAKNSIDDQHWSPKWPFQQRSAPRENRELPHWSNILECPGSCEEKKGPFKQCLNQSHVLYLIWEDIFTDADAPFFRWSFIHLRKFKESYKNEWLLFLPHIYCLTVHKSVLRPFLLLMNSLTASPNFKLIQKKDVNELRTDWLTVFTHTSWNIMSTIVHSPVYYSTFISSLCVHPMCMHYWDRILQIPLIIMQCNTEHYNLHTGMMMYSSAVELDFIRLHR